MEIPAVSVIIPMYNAEKYVGECLDSILAQTFQNFEVIVVDDCSTDNSAAIVESYIPKFKGRLKLSRMKKNSGNAGLPRRKSIAFSRGEYIYFFDPDDAITPTALEELYTLAKKFDADVVHCEKYFEVPDDKWNNAEFRKNLKPFSWTTGYETFMTAPTFLTENLEQRAVDFCKRWIPWNVWLQLVRRDFIIDNEITYVEFYNDDMVFTLCSVCSAKKYLVVPNAVYFYRRREGSIVTAQLNVDQILHRNLEALKYGMKYLDEYLSECETFAQRPDLKYTVFDRFTAEMLGQLINIYSQIPAPALDEILRKEFEENSAFTTFIFSAANIWRGQLMQASQRVAELENELKRIRTNS